MKKILIFLKGHARIFLLSGLLPALIVAVVWREWKSRLHPTSTANPVSAMPVETPRTEASRAEIERTCGGCHAYPPPETFAKSQWSREVDRGFRFLKEAGTSAETPLFSSIVAYYQNRAPERLPLLEQSHPVGPCPVRFHRTGYRTGDGPRPPAIANVRFVRLSDERKFDVVACDMVNGKVFLLKPYELQSKVRVVSDAIPNPAHVEVIDLDGDGIKDLLVANLGSPAPTDECVGSVVWLKGRHDLSFTPFTLAAGLGRVADVQAADFDADGDLDLIVAEFGWLKTGGIQLLENRTTDDEKPVFVPSTIDSRHGGIHVPVADLNGDGRPDFVALISQEHEKVVAFLNQGNARFLPRDIYAAPHPAFGSSGIQLVDLDGDGDQDVLMSNGDALDLPMLRPYHGVQWLENRGSYPFQHHALTSLYGAHRAVAADIDGDGDLDIVAVAFLPGSFFESPCRVMELDAVILLEQTGQGRFVRHSLETVNCDHPTCDLGDFDGDGRVDLVTGNAFVPDNQPSIGVGTEVNGVVLWRNLGPSEPEKSPAARTIESAQKSRLASGRP